MTFGIAMIHIFYIMLASIDIVDRRFFICGRMKGDAAENVWVVVFYVIFWYNKREETGTEVLGALKADKGNFMCF